MIRLIFTDLKNMLKRPLIASLLALGFVVGGFAMLVYFAESTQELKRQNYLFGNENMVEAVSTVYMEAEVRKFWDVVTGDKLPEINYASVVCHANADYDIVGLYWEEESAEAAGGGRFIDRTMMGQYAAVVQTTIPEWSGVGLGDSVRISGRNLEVVGLLAEDDYSPYVYDMRRLALGSEHVAGTRLEGVDAELRHRPNRAVIIPMDTFAELGLTPSYYHISFTEDITQTRSEIEKILMEEVALTQFTDMTQFMEVTRINQLSKALVYAAAVLAGLVNIVSLYAFFLRENRKQFVTYQMLGATTARIAVLILAELFIYTFVAFCISCAGALPFIKYSGFVQRYMPFRLIDFALLFALLYLCAVLASMGLIRSLARKPVAAAGRRGRDGRPADGEGDEQGSRGKFIYLLSFRYQKNWGRALSIAFLSLTTAFALAYAMTYVYDSGRLERYVEKTFPNDVIAIALNTKIVDSIYATDSVSTLDHEYIRELERRLESLNLSVGRLSWRMFTQSLQEAEGEGEGEEFIYLCQVNDAFAAAAPVALKKGSWQPLAEYDASDETAVIPCIIPPDKERLLPMGSEFEYMVSFVVSGGSETGFEDVQAHMRRFRVVGVMDGSAYYFSGADNLNENATIMPDIYTVIEALDSPGKAVNLQFPGFIPDITYQGKRHWQSIDIPNYYLFPQEGDNISVAEINAALSGLGGAHSLRHFVDVYMDQYKAAGGNIYFMHAAVASALLILGVGGYSIMLFAANKRTYGIYYVCGMPWSKAAGLTVAGNALDMLLPAAVGAVVGVYAAQGVRSFDNATIALSILTGLGAVAAVYALTSAIIALSMRKARPKRLMTADGQ